MLIEIVSDRVEVSYQNLPATTYQSNMEVIICDAASEPYRRGDARRWFAPKLRPALEEVNGRVC